ncbi:MAG: phytanoyl-CoA dioxygenase family protein [Candidatus Poribacteria bacterium]|jgi:ectoine hydroxylase-related dioxygenase (phytanoyl-CoA dioxygenase family)|nr:phytanoyl-CoA dioxygenase family protein [Candidatus Poribacteria bacterium]MDP6999931.1 phytanoyl-CoA dioxygenase family protein [Candidatus Poribacteria bacterium]
MNGASQEWLRYCATQEQLDTFNDDGYLVVEDALPPQMVEQLTEVVDRIETEERKRQNLSSNQLLVKFRTVIEDDIFLELLDWPQTFPLVWDILGWNIQLYISHLIVYPAEPEKDKVLAGGWHQDGGRPVQEMERPQPRLSLKISYWLSNVDSPDNGAMQIIPGSHKRDALPLSSDSDSEKILDLCVKAGTAVLFDRRMSHRRGLNTSNTSRKVLFFGYSYRWLRGLDFNLMPEEILKKCDPIRRQLLGDGVDIKGWWQPTEADVPLRTWIKEHRGEELPIWGGS